MYVPIEALAMADADYMECNIKIDDLECDSTTPSHLQFEAFKKDIFLFSSSYHLISSTYGGEGNGYDHYLCEKVGIQDCEEMEPRRGIRSIGKSMVRMIKCIFTKLKGVIKIK